jgi:hypothetical protein
MPSQNYCLIIYPLEFFLKVQSPYQQTKKDLPSCLLYNFISYIFPYSLICFSSKYIMGKSDLKALWFSWLERRFSQIILQLVPFLQSGHCSNIRILPLTIQPKNDILTLASHPVPQLPSLFYKYVCVYVYQYIHYIYTHIYTSI